MKQKIYKTKNQGFTLIELIVVIAVIGIISTIGVSSFTNYLKVARDARRKADLLEIKKYLDSHYALYGKYPRAGSCAYGANCYVHSTATGDVWIPELVSIAVELPKDPNNNAAGPWVTGNFSYSYGNVTSDGQGYDLFGQLENIGDPDRCGNVGYDYGFTSDIPLCWGERFQFSKPNPASTSNPKAPYTNHSSQIIDVSPPNESKIFKQ